MLRDIHNLLVFLLFLTLGPRHVHSVKESNEMCGMSIHAADMDGVDSFSAVEGTWAVPTFFDSSEANFFRTGVALCCGDDCLMRLTAIMWVWGGQRRKTASLEIEVTPNFLTVMVPEEHAIDLNPGDIIKFRVAVHSEDTAELQFTKFYDYINPHTLTVRLTLERRLDHNAILHLSFHTDYVQDEHITSEGWGYKGVDKPKFCGDSAWWYLSDKFVRLLDDGPKLTSPFSPVLVADHRLETAGNKTLPGDLMLSPFARYWSLVRRNALGDDKAVCSTSGFVDSGMMIMHTSNNWMVYGAGLGNSSEVEEA
ncbi:hypothetical protein VTJ49DRAFT_4586 [Mycothermus thermophilus]|uniref:Uncharacterized protein n=1 Tax=Humicola insolens TaxID=85995 RepID=A0ABR3V695_HUMIN